MARRDLTRVDTYEAVFTALSHDARRRVLLTIYFNGGSMTAGEIAAIFAHAWQTTSRHLRVLVSAGLLTQKQMGRNRIYEIQRKRLVLVADWLGHFVEAETFPGEIDMTKKQRQDTVPVNEMTPEQNVDTPRLFRLNIEVGDLATAISFYSRLLGVEGRRQAGSRCYFDCGSITLQVVDVSTTREPHPAAKALYFAVKDLDAAFERYSTLNCASSADSDVTKGVTIEVRPWGERSFYVEDPWHNPICFVEEGSEYLG